ncbi:hypothetical protein [Nitrosococcus watsonii]|uniref:Uncharacterized protein n=1 Tax=Nitrosococcus watsoni (strain C-113) TaxID=105559 RepID=D8K9K3_NITWC|nr:hypothetical protein [Nitrosococcus watsonii]ADJ27292.1 conserved hypothetical protein [Nitrosococcus watsonii C-113]
MANNEITGDVTYTPQEAPKEARRGTLRGTINISGDAASIIRNAVEDSTKVTLQRTAAAPTEDQPLWVAIRNRTQAIGFNRYHNFIDRVLCEGEQASGQEGYGSPSVTDNRVSLASRPTIHGVDAYSLLKLATDAFLIFECGVRISNAESFNAAAESNRLEQPVTIDSVRNQLSNFYLTGANQNVLPYLDRIVRQIVGLDATRQAERLPYCEAILQHRLTCPSLLELIWSYWHEEGMLVQTLNAIALRFQNRRGQARDPLISLELDPLRPLNNLLWGFVQDEYNRLSVRRRAYEYDHHYGFALVGKAVSDFHPVDSRSKFLEAFHNLLYRTALFYKDDDDTTIIADAFALLNALREVHLILAEGAHNQFGDLPWTARREMLIMQWLLARPEIKEFLRGRYMVPYQEPWMGAVDAMKRLQGWSDVTVTHFHELAIYGEQILLSIRYGDWIDVNDQQQARNWARYWRPEIQRYIHAYLATTGVDLSVEMTDTRQAAERFLQPSVHLQKRLVAQRGRHALPSAMTTARVLPSEVFGYAELPAPVHGRGRLLKHRAED